MLKETYTEHLAIVRAIAAGDTGAWSDDCAALTAVLARMEALETENARLRTAIETEAAHLAKDAYFSVTGSSPPYEHLRKREDALRVTLEPHP